MAGELLVRAGPDPATSSARDRVDRALAAPRRRHRLVSCALILLLAVVAVARTLLGDIHISPAEFFRVIVQGEQIPGVSFILREITLPRTILGAVTGAALGVAGGVFQTVLRNPLASPDIVGVSMGASAGAVFGIVTLGLRGFPISLFAVVGAVAMAGLTWWIAGRTGSMRVVLVGIGISAALGSVIHYLFTRADVWDAQIVLRWLTGSVAAADWSTIAWATPTITGLLLAVAWFAGDLSASELGQQSAVGLGMSPHRPDVLLGVGVLLTALAVGAVGPMAFVAFMSGPLARGLNAGRRSLTAAGLIGAIVIVAADYVGDYLLIGINFPAGVVTGAAGAVFLLWLMSRGRTGRRSS